MNRRPGHEAPSCPVTGRCHRLRSTNGTCRSPPRRGQRPRLRAPLLHRQRRRSAHQAPAHAQPESDTALPSPSPVCRTGAAAAQKAIAHRCLEDSWSPARTDVVSSTSMTSWRTTTSPPCGLADGTRPGARVAELKRARPMPLNWLSTSPLRRGIHGEQSHRERSTHLLSPTVGASPDPAGQACPLRQVRPAQHRERAPSEAAQQ